MNMRPKKRSHPAPVVAVCMLPLIAGTAFGDDNADLLAAFKSGTAGVNVRARYEHVDQDNLSDNADAMTARLRLNFRTGKWNRVSGFVEYDTLFHLLSDFNSGAGTSPAKGQFPVVADPKGSDLNQLFLDYDIDENSRLRVGRQRILLDNQRFVGGVGWRQNEQTYDGITYTSSALAKMDFSYSYLSYVRRIFGEKVAAGKNNVDAHLLQAAIAVNDQWSVTPYYYRIDNQDVAAFSTATAGARLVGKFTAGDNKLDVIAEVATQSDIANNPVSYDATYAHLSGTLILPEGFSVGVGYETLGGSAEPGKMFRTPLATLHAFQGWADRFLATPGAGIEDVYATVKFKAGAWSINGVYHDFSAETGSADFGSEIDASIGRKLDENYSILLKGAFFSGEQPTLPDTNKFWVMITANY